MPKDIQATQSMAPVSPAKTVAPRRNRVVGPVILASCLLIAVMAVLLVPVLTGGAVSAGAASSHSPAMERTVSVYSDYEAANNAVPFAAEVPADTLLPEGEYRVLDGEVLEMTLLVNGTEVLFRTAPGNEDLSGDYTEYAYSATETVDGVARSYLGSAENKLYVAVWAEGGRSFALVAQSGIAGDEMRQLAESVG